MLKKFVVATAVFATASYAVAQPAPVAEDISGLLGPSQVGVDVSVQAPGANWLTAGLFAQTSNGAAFIYAVNADPNDAGFGQNDLTAPAPNGSDGLVTFISKPRGQTATKRFTNNGAPDIAGAYLTQSPGSPPPPDATADEVDVAYFNNPAHPIEPLDEQGYIQRVVLDITGAGVNKADVYVNTTGQDAAGPGHILLAIGQTGVGHTLNSDALDEANIVRWSIWAVPEPASLALLVLGGLAAFRRR